MIRDYKSYSDEWLTHVNAWIGYSANEITSDFCSSYALTEEVVLPRAPNINLNP